VEIRKLFKSSDPQDERSVWFLSPNQGRVYKYVAEQTTKGRGTLEQYPWVKLLNAEGVDGLPSSGFPMATYAPAAPDGTFHRVTGWTEFDGHGLPKQSTYEGFHRYSSAPLYEHANCDQYTEVYVTQFDPSTWVHNAVGGHRIGGEAESGTQDCHNQCTAERPCNQVTKKFNAFGDMLESEFIYHEVDGTQRQVSKAVVKEYNRYGQVTHEYAGCGTGTCERHTQNVYTDEDDGDLFYSGYIRQEVAYVPDGAVKEFRTKARWQPGAAAVTKLTSADGDVSLVEYDALGRFVRAFGADPRTGQLCSEPAKEVYYHYAVDGGDPLNRVDTWVNTSREPCGADRWETVRTWTDGLGRAYAEVRPGDKVHESAARYPWVVTGSAKVNAKGMAVEKCSGVPLDDLPGSALEVLIERRKRQALMAGELNRPDGKWLCSYEERDAFGRMVAAYGPASTTPDGYVVGKAEYGVDSVRSFDHIQLQKGTYSEQRVDGLGRAVETKVLHDATPDQHLALRRSTWVYGAVGGPLVATTEEEDTKVSRRALYDTLGRLRINQDLNFGQWRYEYNTIGELTHTVSPTGNVAQYDYDQAGRLVRERYDGAVDAEYFYDRYPGDAVLGLTGNPEWAGYPAWSRTLGALVAVKDRTGVSLSAADRGSRAESWRMVKPDNRLYHTAGLVDGAGQLIYAEDEDGKRSTLDYFADGTVKSSYYDGIKVIDEVKSNWLGQAELIKYGDAAQTVGWTGYDPVTGQVLASVVQQQNRVYSEGAPGEKVTLLAYGYQYDEEGRIEGIVDWRGRGAGQSPRMGIAAPHPTSLAQMRTGTHFSQYPSAFDRDLKGPRQWNSGDNLGQTGWPVGMSPYDLKVTHDDLNGLVEEDREFITGTGDDLLLDPETHSVVGMRLRSADYVQDALGSLTSWTETSSSGVSQKNFGRALGSRILNGAQLNQQAGCDMNVLAQQGVLPPPGSCYLPDALYFASNIAEVGANRGTCIWVEYDPAGRMVKQTQKTGCSTCDYVGTAADKGVGNATCSKNPVPAVGTPGQLGYQPELVPKTTVFEYTWNAIGQLAGARKFENGSHKLTMAYAYDASGSRVIREKSDIVGGQLTNIKQDLYLGGYERRGVQLTDSQGTPRSIFAAIWDSGSRGTYRDIEGSKVTKQASGLRIDREWNASEGKFGPEERYLTLGNHLGSASAVIDFDTGALVEWRTSYAFGGDETHWKNGDVKYDDNDEPYKFTGKEEDEAVGLFYFGARYYSAGLGRWLSPDPPVVHGVQGGNYFAYCGNSPYLYTDPDGNDFGIGEFVAGVVIAIVVAAAVSTVTQVVQTGTVDPLLLLKDTVCAAGTYVAAYFGGVAGAALAAIGQYFVDTLARGRADTMATGDFWTGVAVQGVTGVISGLAGSAGGYVGSAVSNAAGSGFGAAVAGVAVSSTLSYIASVGTQLTATALAYGVGAAKESYDEILVNGAISAGVGAAVSIGMSGGSAVMGAVGNPGDNTQSEFTRHSATQPDADTQAPSREYDPREFSMPSVRLRNSLYGEASPPMAQSGIPDERLVCAVPIPVPSLLVGGGLFLLYGYTQTPQGQAQLEQIYDDVGNFINRTRELLRSRAKPQEVTPPESAAEPKPRSQKPPAKRYRYDTRKEAEESARRVGKGNPPRHDPNDPKGPHFHPDVPPTKPGDPVGRPDPHDHYFYPKGR
jgi:RHS repeat-associated protein